MKQLRLLITICAFLVSTFLHAEVSSGTCGKNLTWTFNSETGLLKIEGSGEMNDYYLSSQVPWYSYHDRILALELPKGLTNIGSSAFYRCSGLTSISIPNSVISIGESAFQDCSGLTSISIPNSVTSIGDYAFYYCSGLTSISIPNSVTSIGRDAFSCCSGLTSISIPNTVTSISFSAFDGCSGLTSISIPNSVTSIGDKAFQDCIGLTSISIPNSVTSIGNNAFEGCSGLTSISIPNSVTSIGGSVFSDCVRLTDPIIVNDMFVFLPKSFKGAYSISSNITKIIGGAFSRCSGLTSISIPNSVTSIGSLAFEGCSGLTSISIPNSVTSIDYGTFEGCSGLTSISIPNSVTSIGGSAFQHCSGLISVSIPKSVISISRDAFDYCDNIKTLSINSSVDPRISCEELYIGDDVTIVQNNFNSWVLRKVVLGKKVAQIRAEAFSYANIQEFTITGEEAPYCYPDIFGTKDLSKATLYVPADKVTYYQTTEPWTKFGTVKTLSGETPSTPTACAKPTIDYENGQLVFNSATTGAKYHCTITSPDMKSDVLCENGTMNLDARYDIAVYATAEGYTQSETATAALYWVKADGSLTDNINAAKMRGVVVTADNGFVSVSGLNDGEQVLFYAMDGKMLGSQKAVNGTASLSTSESVVICKVGTTSLKVLVK